MASDRNWAARPLNLLLTGLVALSVSLLAAGGLFAPLEDQLTSSRARLLERPPTGETVIVEIDARSMSALSSWPWPRRHHAELVRQLHRSGASIIAFDVDFSARSDGGDTEFGAAIDQAGQVILPIFEQKYSDQANDRRTISSRPNASLSGAWVGGVNIFPDRDGVVRDYPAATFIEGAVQPSIATLLAEKNGLGVRSFQPDWSIDVARIPRFSFSDAIGGRIPDAALRGKRVLVGATAIELGDRYAVPRYGVVPGVVVQALATESLLQDRAIRRTSLGVTIALIVLIAFAFRPKPLLQSRLHGAKCAVTLCGILAMPLVVQQLWPLSIDSAALLFTLFASVALQVGVEASRRLRLRAETDSDSGLPNRVRLEKDLAAGSGQHRILVTAAIERFAAIRDSIGIEATSELIQEVARIIESRVGSGVYRIAPDTLAWPMPDEAEGCQGELTRVQTALRDPIPTGEGVVDISVTLGLARVETGLAGVLVIERALSAVTTARSAGQSHDWYRGADPQLRRQLSMMGELRAAMTDGRLRLAYQPKLSLATGQIADAEALVRWVGTDGINIPPDAFIPLAETTGVVREITMFAIRKAASDMTAWAQQGRFARIAVNISALDLATPGFADEVERILDLSGLSPNQLALEVTESALIKSAEAAVATLSQLRRRGIRLAVDDYGTGQSTLSYLKKLPVHELKIDRSFVTNVSASEADAIMVRSTIDLAHDLGLEVVAEGIEDHEALDALARMGCDYAQGYFIGKPMEASDFCRIIAESGASPRRVA